MKSEKHGPSTKWKPGQSGNPAGRPRSLLPVQELARAYTAEAVQTLAAIMRGCCCPPAQPGEATVCNCGVKPADRAKAADLLLSRAWGAPTQPVDIAGDGAQGITVIIKRFGEAALEGPQTGESSEGHTGTEK